MRRCKKKHESEPPKKRRAVTAGTDYTRRVSKPNWWETPVTRRIVVKAMKVVRVDYFEGRDQPETAGTAPGPSVLAMMQKGVSQAEREFNKQFVQKHMEDLKLDTRN